MPEISPTKYLVTATWADCPHLSEEEKEQLWGSIPPHERDARSKGVPSLGRGAVWPIMEERIQCEPFKVPEYWPVAFALDVGWNNTAALWGAWDRDSDIVYVWSEYKVGEEKPPVHAAAIKARGEWIPGVVDPASRGRGQDDGVALFTEYQELGLNLDFADNTVRGPESGVFKVYRRMVEGRLKIFSTCTNFWDEFRLYRRGENGKIVKEHDHLCDCLRYLVVSGMELAVDKLMALDLEEYTEVTGGGNATTGY